MIGVRLLQRRLSAKDLLHDFEVQDQVNTHRSKRCFPKSYKQPSSAQINHKTQFSEHKASAQNVMTYKHLCTNYRQDNFITDENRQTTSDEDNANGKDNTSNFSHVDTLM